MQFTILKLALAMAGTSMAHTSFQEFYVNGVSAGAGKGIRLPIQNSPLQDLTSTDLICNKARTPLPTDIIPVPAGSNVTTEWHHENGPNPSDTSDPVDPSHRGPIMVYMAKVDSATTTTVTGLRWFKIYEDGLVNGEWATQRFAKTKGKVDLQIPPCIANGDYLLRAETIALHEADRVGGAQLYMECAQLTVSGGGSVSPAGVAIPGIYTATDPGIKFNLYNNPTNYTIPGPALFTCDGQASGATTGATVGNSATSPNTTAPPKMVMTTLTTAFLVPAATPYKRAF